MKFLYLISPHPVTMPKKAYIKCWYTDENIIKILVIMNSLLSLKLKESKVNPTVTKASIPDSPPKFHDVGGHVHH